MAEGVPMSEKDLGIIETDESGGGEVTETPAIKRQEEVKPVEVLETPAEMPVAPEIASGDSGSISQPSGGIERSGVSGAVGGSSQRSGSEGAGIGKQAVETGKAFADEVDIFKSVE